MIQTAPRVEIHRPKQSGRDTLANIFMAAWACVILQGALRKWVFPGLTIMYLVQDVPLLFAYIYAVYKGLIWSGKLAAVCVIGSLFVCMHAMLQLILVGVPLKTGIVGLHHYLFYVPILFLAPVCYNQKHRVRFIRWNLFTTIPMALISTLQSRAPKGAWINRTSAGDDTAFGIAGSDAVRATGTFNFTLPFSIWCGIVVALAIGEWLLPPERRSIKNTALLFVCSMCAILTTLVSGSRTALVLAATAFFGGFLAVIITGNHKYLLRFVLVAILLPILAGLAYVVAPSSFTGNVNRFTSEGAETEFTTRIENMTVGFLTQPDSDLIGIGIGSGIQASNVGSTQSYAVTLSEWDTIRGVQELGLFTGGGLVLIRYAGAVMLFLAGLQALKQKPSFPHALPLAVCIMPSLAIGDLWRVAPQLATQIFFSIALICGAILFRREPQDTATL